MNRSPAVLYPYSAKVRAWLLALPMVMMALVLASAILGFGAALLPLALLAAGMGTVLLKVARTAYVLQDGRLRKRGLTLRFFREIDLSRPLRISTEASGSFHYSPRTGWFYPQVVAFDQGSVRLSIPHGGQDWPAFAARLAEELRELGQEEAAEALGSIPDDFREPLGGSGPRALT